MTIATESSTCSLAARALVRYCILLFGMSCALFGSAGTFDFWQAKLYIVVIFSAGFVAGVVLLGAAPDLVERRLHYREERKEQKCFVKLGMLLQLLLCAVPGIDQRYGLSNVPVHLVYVSLLVVLVSYLLLAYVLLVNRYASRVIEVEKNQKVISHGPYAWVRHPMYSFMAPMCLCTPMALGSWWALIPAIGLILILIFRLIDEETALQAELEGYKEYMQKTRYRLIPFVY